MREAAAERHWIPSWASQRATARPEVGRFFVGRERQRERGGGELVFSLEKL